MWISGGRADSFKVVIIAEVELGIRNLRLKVNYQPYQSHMPW